MIRKGKVSVCMATYNGEKYIRPQLDSILKQLSLDDEVIISDDSSTDKTVDIIKSYNDQRIRLYVSCFHNYIKNFEFSLKQASGEYIFLSDQDDIWNDKKVEIMLKALDRSDLVCSNCQVVDKDLKPLSNAFWNNSIPQRSGFINNLHHNHYLGCCMAFNSNILQLAIPFPNKLITHDGWIGLVAEMFCKPMFIDDKLILYRRHGNNTSNTTEGSTLSLFQQISYRFVIIKGIIQIFIRNKIKRSSVYLQFTSPQFKFTKFF